MLQNIPYILSWIIARQQSTKTPHPTSNILAVTPESASTIVVLGRARDLGMCQVLSETGRFVARGATRESATFVIGMCKMVLKDEGQAELNSQSGMRYSQSQ